MVLVTACSEDSERQGVDFLPLTVDYRENTYASGRIPGGFFKREGRPTEREILTCRVIDRGLRPLRRQTLYAVMLRVKARSHPRTRIEDERIVAGELRPGHYPFLRLGVHGERIVSVFL